jgi:hypothetical protein
MPVQATYDSAVGVWRIGPHILALDPRVALASKKPDIETGEDRKGE